MSDSKGLSDPEGRTGGRGMTAPAAQARIGVIDVARGVALLAMATYHFAWDLEAFRYLEPGTVGHGGWKLFARAIASSFLVLVGVSLFLAHRDGVRWPGFLRRLAMVAGAALAISAVTWFATPDAFIFFGILHEIALASLLALSFLRFPWPVTVLAVAAVIAAPHYLRSEFFDDPWWWWLGLSSADPRSNDYVPVFPWFGAVLAGVAAARLASSRGVFDRLARLHIARPWRAFAWAGRHSLAFYLLHQPLLFGGVYLFSLAAPVPAETPQVEFRRTCEAGCGDVRNEEFCVRYCICMLDSLESEHMLGNVMSGRGGEEQTSRIENFARACTATADQDMLEGTPHE